ncbi:AMP-dependent synthetase/ligase [Bacteroidota bacterium]
MEIKRTFDILDRYKTVNKREVALCGKKNGEWHSFSSDEYIEISNYVSYGLLELGLKKGDKIATVSNNRPEWNFIDMGMSQIGVVHVPVYPTLSEEEYTHIFKHSGVKLLVLSDNKLYKTLKPVADKIPAIKHIYSFNEIDGLDNFNQIIDLGKENQQKYSEEVEKIKASIHPDDMVSIIYTSGTTGLSKGVMLSHNNFISNVMSAMPVVPLDPHDKALSFLPLCHVFERMVCYLYQYIGINIYYAENMGTIGRDLKELKVHVFVSVPRLLESVFDKIIAKGKDLKGIKKSLFFWAVNLGLRYEHNRENGWFYELQLKIANKLIFDKWRDALGGNIKLVVSGGAALQPRLARVFWAAGIIAMEGYGLTETSPVVAVNYNHYPKAKFGTVGPIVDNVEVKIADDGEILVKGPNIMLGYYNDKEKTDEVIDKDGWFHTGDVGEIVEGKFLKITDRKKEIFKNSAGKYIAPQVIENKFKESFFIEQIIVVGENQKFASAIITPNVSFLHDYSARKKIHYRDNKELIKNPIIIARMQKEVDIINKTLGFAEQIKRFRLVSEEWSTDTGELSPTLKLKRKFITEKYSDVLEEIYSVGHDNIGKE